MKHTTNKFDPLSESIQHFANWRSEASSHRDVKTRLAKQAYTGAGSSISGCKLYAMNFDNTGMRLVGACDEIRKSIRHKGWYVSDSGSEIVRGYVVQLPSRRGKEVYYPAISFTGYDCCVVDLLCQSDNKEDAAIWADCAAEIEAERLKELDRRYLAEQDIENLTTENEQLRLDINSLAEQIRLIINLQVWHTPAVNLDIIKTTLEGAIADKETKIEINADKLSILQNPNEVQ